jgi:hypothetical protein
MARRRFSEREVLATLLHQGVEIRCFRSNIPITVDTVNLVEREHLAELALDGPDEPRNCRYSFKHEHAKITNGTKATTLGSSKHKIAKDKRLRAGKLTVKRKPRRTPSERKKKKTSTWRQQRR